VAFAVLLPVFLEGLLKLTALDVDPVVKELRVSSGVVDYRCVDPLRALDAFYERGG
jgi:hypothetical protein